MEKDTLPTVNQVISSTPVETQKQYNEEDDFYDEDNDYYITASLGNMKNDPASVRSRPRNIPVSRLQLTDEEKIPKMPEPILREPNLKEYDTKIKEIQNASKKKKESIDALFAQRKAEIYGMKVDDKDNPYTKFNEIKAKADALKAKIDWSEKGTKPIREEYNQLNSRISKFSKSHFPSSVNSVTNEIHDIQEKLSFSELTPTEEKKYNDRKEQLSEYLVELKKINDFRDKHKDVWFAKSDDRKILFGYYDEMKKLKTLKEANKAKKDENKPIIGQIDAQITALKAERKEFEIQVRELYKEYDDKLYKYNEQQKLIDYIKRAQEKIRNIKRDIRKREKMEKRKEGDVVETASEIQGEVIKARVYDNQIADCNLLNDYFKRQVAHKPEEKVELLMNKITENTKLDEDIKKGFVKEIQSKGNELEISAGGPLKKKGKAPKAPKREGKSCGLVLDFEIIKKINALGLTPPIKNEDIPKFLDELTQKKELYVKDNVEVQSKTASSDQKKDREESHQ